MNWIEDIKKKFLKVDSNVPSINFNNDLALRNTFYLSEDSNLANFTSLDIASYEFAISFTVNIVPNNNRNIPQKKAIATSVITIVGKRMEPTSIRNEVNMKAKTAEKFNNSARLSFKPLFNRSSIWTSIFCNLPKINFSSSI